MPTVRPVARIVRALETSDGAGVRLYRGIGTRELLDLDPFLLFDEFRSDRPDQYIGGFPDHPHRGFETVTYMLAGRMRHRDSKGNSGVLGPGSVQWMTAGRGVVHSEMPEQEAGLMWGFQLWVNLPARDKLIVPRYQEFPAQAIPTAGRVKVIAGRYGDAIGPVATPAVDALYLDVTLSPQEHFTTPVPGGHNALAYPFEASVEIGGQTVRRGSLAVLGAGDAVAVHAGAEAARVLLIAGRRLGEPIARRGPFVMNTQQELIQAFEDYAAGKF